MRNWHGNLSPFGDWHSARRGGEFSPAVLFAGGEEGAWYEPSTTTCFTDTAGTIAATYGDAVARINDLSGNGNHATQAIAPARPILARVPSTGRRNLLERTEEFDDAYWTKTNATVTANAAAAPDGAVAADKLVEGYSSSSHFVARTLSATSAVTYTATVYAKAGERSVLQISPSGNWLPTPYANYDLSAGLVTASSGNVSAGIEGVGGGWYRCVATFTATASASGGFAFFVQNSPTAARGAAYTGDGTSGIYLWGAQIEAASSASAYQKVVDQYDITEAGVTSLEYLAFDGSDDGMATASIDFTATDKMSVFAGIGKESDDVGILAELGNALPNGSFSVQVPGGNGGDFPYRFVSKGTLSAATINVGSFNAPITNVGSFFGDISGDIAKIRIDGSDLTTATGDQGTGNYGNYPLYIGARNNAASVWFEGKLFSLIVRGAASTAQEISDTEAYLAAKSGVTLP